MIEALYLRMCALPRVHRYEHSRPEARGEEKAPATQGHGKTAVPCSIEQIGLSLVQPKYALYGGWLRHSPVSKRPLAGVSRYQCGLYGDHEEPS